MSDVIAAAAAAEGAPSGSVRRGDPSPDRRGGAWGVCRKMLFCGEHGPRSRRPQPCRSRRSLFFPTRRSERPSLIRIDSFILALDEDEFAENPPPEPRSVSRIQTEYVV